MIKRGILKRTIPRLALALVLCLSFVMVLTPAPAHAVTLDLYWVGGTGNWTDHNHWDLHDDGAGGDPEPTVSDNVHFSDHSFSGAGQILTVDAAACCRNMDWTGATNTPTLAGTSVLSIYGDTTLITGTNVTATLWYFYPAVSQTLFSAGKTLQTVQNYNGGIIQLLDTLNCGILKLNTGTWDTNDQIVNVGQLMASSTNARTLDQGSSVINVSISLNLGGTGGTTTLTANTGTFNLTGTAPFYGGTPTGSYGTINLNGTSHTVAGTFTCANLTRTGTATNANTVTFTSGTTVTVSGTLTLTGNSRANQLLVQSSTLGTAATIHATNWTVTNTDLMDITADTHLPDLSAQTDVGDCGGNTGITFPAGVAQTSGQAGNWSHAAEWTSRIPLPQDDVSCSHNMTVDMPRIGKSVSITAGTATLSQAISIYGSFTFAPGITWTDGVYGTEFYGRGAYSITSSGKTFRSVVFYRGTYTLLDNFSAGASGTLSLYGGTVIASANVTSSYQVLFSSGVLNMGSGTWTLNASGVTTLPIWRFIGVATVNCETSTIVITNSSTNARTFDGFGLTYNNVTVSGAGNYALTITGNNTFNTFKVDASAAPKTIVATGTVQTVNNFQRGSAIGTNVVTLTGGTWTKAVRTTIPIALDYMAITGSTATPANTWYAGVTPAHSTDGGGNTGWVFTQVALPAVTTNAATLLTMTKDAVTGGTLNATIADIDGTPTIETYFQMSTDMSYSIETTHTTIYASGVFTGVAPNNLTPGATYNVRGVATNTTGTVNGSNSTFTLTMPSITTTAANNVAFTKDAVTSGNWRVEVTNMGVATSAYVDVDFGTAAPAYGTNTADSSATGTGIVSIAMPATLTPGQTYHFRGNVIVGATRVNGTDLTAVFTLPSITTANASGIKNTGSTSATLNGDITNLGKATSVYGYFQYSNGTVNKITGTQTLFSTGVFTDLIRRFDPAYNQYRAVLQITGIAPIYGSWKSTVEAPQWFSIWRLIPLIVCIGFWIGSGMLGKTAYARKDMVMGVFSILGIAVGAIMLGIFISLMNGVFVG
jgi:hypothetical protein